MSFPILGKDQVGSGIREDGGSSWLLDLVGAAWVLGWTGRLAGIRKMLGLIRDRRGTRRKGNQVALGMTVGKGPQEIAEMERIPGSLGLRRGTQ